MNLVYRKLPCWLASILNKKALNIYNLENNKTTQNIFDLFLGVLAAIVAVPLITSIVMSSIFVTQQEWDNFWDMFLEI